MLMQSKGRIIFDCPFLHFLAFIINWMAIVPQIWEMLSSGTVHGKVVLSPMELARILKLLVTIWVVENLWSPSYWCLYTWLPDVIDRVWFNSQHIALWEVFNCICRCLCMYGCGVRIPAKWWRLGFAKRAGYLTLLYVTNHLNSKTTSRETETLHLRISST